jgi:hypothetical protein
MVIREAGQRLCLSSLSRCCAKLIKGALLIIRDFDLDDSCNIDTDQLAEAGHGCNVDDWTYHQDEQRSQPTFNTEAHLPSGSSYGQRIL